MPTSNELRVLGRSVTVRITQDGALLSEITAIKNFTFETRQKILTEGYLGEGANRQDEIFEEVGGSFTVNPETTQILALQKAIMERSQRRQSGDTVINCTFRISFPNGQVARITIPEMQFDPIVLNIDARDSYPGMSFTYKSNRCLISI